MKPTKHRQLLRPIEKNHLLLPLAMLWMAGASAHAATIAFSTTAPTFDGDDITQLTMGTLATNSISYGGDFSADNANYIAFDRPAQGQTFTPGAAGQITSITVKSTTGTSSIPSGIQLTLRISTVSGTTLAPFYTDVAVLPSGNGIDISDKYVTFTLTTPQTVVAGTTYGFDFGNTPGNEGFYFQIDGAANSSYAGGTSYSSGVKNGFGTTTADVRSTDRTFGISIVPEPSAALLGGLGILTLLVRRRRA